eukprot:m.225080 g.225080  ORF g.225080 m.225080 type:complete len:323 (+) comp11208_c0_seq1:21-989(+)
MVLLQREGVVLGCAFVLASVYLWYSGCSGPGLYCWLLTILVSTLRAVDELQVIADPVNAHRARMAYAIAMCFMPLAFHAATGQAVIASGKPLWDRELLQLDELLLGWLFPQGQLALWADANNIVNPAAIVGSLITEILQIAYVTYYLWANGIVIYLLLQLSQDPQSPQRRQRLRQIVAGLVAAYVTNFMINFLIPAVSPRLHLHDQYLNELEGVFLGKFFQSAIKAAAGGDALKPKSFGAFPSGHVGITWFAFLAARRLGLTRYAQVARIAAILMTMAVVYLRYHYAVDAIFAIVLPAAGLWAGVLTGAPDTGLHDHAPLPL